MGWSCSADASRVMDSWVRECRRSTGSSNTWVARGRTFFWDTSRREYDDGSVTGSVLEIPGGLPADRDAGFSAVKVGSFKLDSRGELTRTTAPLRAMGIRAALADQRTHRGDALGANV